MITMPPKETFDLFKRTNGACSLHEMVALAWLAEQAPDGVCMDIGTNNGKIAIAIADGLSRQPRDRTLHCIDTVFDLNNVEAWKDNRTHEGPMTTGWAWIYEPDFHDKVKARILQASRGMVTPDLIGDSALKIIPKLTPPPVAFALSDADNTMKWLVDGIADLLAPNMAPEGIIAWHDWNSQFIPPKEASDRLVATGAFEQIEIPWDEIQTIVDQCGGEHPPDQNSWHHKETPRPMFVGAIRRK